MEAQTEVKTFRLPITVERKADLGLEMSHLLRDAEAMVDDLKRHASNVKDDIKGKLGKARRLGTDIEDGTESQDVECRKEVDFKKNAVRYCRIPDGLVLAERAMTGTEREAAAQKDLPMDGKKGKGKSTAK